MSTFLRYHWPQSSHKNQRRELGHNLKWCGGALLLASRANADVSGAGAKGVLTEGIRAHFRNPC